MIQSVLKREELFIRFVKESNGNDDENRNGDKKTKKISINETTNKIFDIYFIRNSIP
jgi:hypothetical protein